MNLIKIIHLHSHQRCNILSKTKSNFTETFFKIKPRLKCNYFGSQSEQPIINKARTFTIKSPLKLVHRYRIKIFSIFQFYRYVVYLTIY